MLKKSVVIYGIFDILRFSLLAANVPRLHAVAARVNYLFLAKIGFSTGKSATDLSNPAIT